MTEDVIESTYQNLLNNKNVKKIIGIYGDIAKEYIREAIYLDKDGLPKLLGIGLALQKGIGLETFKLLKDVYIDLEIEFSNAEILVNVNSDHNDTHVMARAKQIANNIRLIEFRMQKLWAFEQDDKFHRYWLETPGCTCPKLDNLDRQGSSQRVINSGCIFHG